MQTRSPNQLVPKGRQRLKYRKCLACVADRREGLADAAACGVCGGSGWELVEIEFDLPWPSGQGGAS
jgi:hypothetical protein